MAQIRQEIGDMDTERRQLLAYVRECAPAMFNESRGADLIQLPLRHQATAQWLDFKSTNLHHAHIAVSPKPLECIGGVSREMERTIAFPDDGEHSKTFTADREQEVAVKLQESHEEHCPQLHERLLHTYDQRRAHVDVSRKLESILHDVAAPQSHDSQSPDIREKLEVSSVSQQGRRARTIVNASGCGVATAIAQNVTRCPTQAKLPRQLLDMSQLCVLLDAHVALRMALSHCCVSDRESATCESTLSAISGFFSLCRQRVSTCLSLYVRDSARDMRKWATSETAPASPHENRPCKYNNSYATDEDASSSSCGERRRTALWTCKMLQDSRPGLARGVKQRMSPLNFTDGVYKQECLLLNEEVHRERAYRKLALVVSSDVEHQLGMRLLYLELLKQVSAVRMDRLRAELSDSIPRKLLESHITELESLQHRLALVSRHNVLLRSELLKMSDLPRQVAHARQVADDAILVKEHARADCEALRRKAQNVISATQVCLRSHSQPRSCPKEEREGRDSCLQDEVLIYQLQIQRLLAQKQAVQANLCACKATFKSSNSRENRNAAQMIPTLTRNEVDAKSKRAHLDIVRGLRDLALASNDEAVALKLENKRLHVMEQVISAQAHLRREAVTEQDGNLGFSVMSDLKLPDAFVIGKLRRELADMKGSHRLYTRHIEVLQRQFLQRDAIAPRMEAHLDVSCGFRPASGEDRRADVHAFRAVLSSILRHVPCLDTVLSLCAGARPSCLGAALLKLGVVSAGLAHVLDLSACTGFQEDSHFHVQMHETMDGQVHETVDALGHVGDLGAALARREAELADLELAHQLLEERYRRLQVDSNTFQTALPSSCTAVPSETHCEGALLETTQSASQLLELTRHLRIEKLHKLQCQRAVAKLQGCKSRVDVALAARESLLATHERREIEMESLALIRNETPYENPCAVQNSMLPACSRVGPSSTKKFDVASHVDAADLRVSHQCDTSRRSCRLSSNTCTPSAQLDRESFILSVVVSELESVREELRLSQNMNIFREPSVPEHGADTLGQARHSDTLGQARHYVSASALVPTTLQSVLTCSQTADKSSVLSVQTSLFEKRMLQKSATLSSLKAVIANRSDELAHVEFKLAKLHSSHREETVAGHLDINGNAECAFTEHEAAITQLRRVVDHMSKCTASEPSAAAPIRIALRVATQNCSLRQSNSALEAYLRVAVAARRRSEADCREAFREIDAQKRDLTLFANHLQAYENSNARRRLPNYTKHAELQSRVSSEKSHAKAHTLLETCRKLKEVLVARHHEMIESGAECAASNQPSPDAAVCTLRCHVKELRRHLGVTAVDAQICREKLTILLSQHRDQQRRYSSICSEVEVLSYAVARMEAKAHQLDTVLDRLRQVSHSVCAFTKVRGSRP